MECKQDCLCRCISSTCREALAVVRCRRWTERRRCFLSFFLSFFLFSSKRRWPEDGKRVEEQRPRREGWFAAENSAEYPMGRPPKDCKIAGGQQGGEGGKPTKGTTRLVPESQTEPSGDAPVAARCWHRCGRGLQNAHGPSAVPLPQREQSGGDEWISHPTSNASSVAANDVDAPSREWKPLSQAIGAPPPLPSYLCYIPPTPLHIYSCANSAATDSLRIGELLARAADGGTCVEGGNTRESTLPCTTHGSHWLAGRCLRPAPRYGPPSKEVHNSISLTRSPRKPAPRRNSCA